MINSSNTSFRSELRKKLSGKFNFFDQPGFKNSETRDFIENTETGEKFIVKKVAALRQLKENENESDLLRSKSSASQEKLAQIETRRSFVVEFITSKFYKEFLGDNAPEINILNIEASDGSLLYTSKFIKGANPLMNEADLVSVKNPERAYALIQMLAEADFHEDNILTDGENIAKIDHGRSMRRCFNNKIYISPRIMMNKYIEDLEEVYALGKEAEEIEEKNEALSKRGLSSATSLSSSDENIVFKDEDADEKFGSKGSIDITKFPDYDSDSDKDEEQDVKFALFLDINNFIKEHANIKNTFTNEKIDKFVDESIKELQKRKFDITDIDFKIDEKPYCFASPNIMGDLNKLGIKLKIKDTELEKLNPKEKALFIYGEFAKQYFRIQRDKSYEMSLELEAFKKGKEKDSKKSFDHDQEDWEKSGWIEDVRNKTTYERLLSKSQVRSK